MDLLEIRNISKYFGGILAVDNFSMKVKENQLIGIIGPNGAGKTTIFNLISGISKTTSGKIFFKGKEITFLKPSQISKLGIARTFQNLRLFRGLDVISNVEIAYTYRMRYNFFQALFWPPILLSENKKFRNLAKESLNFVKVPTNYYYEKPANLPYGLQKRVDLARALSLLPQVLLLDEPAAGLNPYEVIELIDIIRLIQKEYQKQNLSIILVEHRMEIIMELCEEIYVLNFGKTIAKGNPEHIQSNENVLSAYLGEEY
jgi:ABC-type branched-subunit amino acid transport system ATPase component